MSDDKVEVKFGANVSDLNSGVSEVKDQLGSLGDSTSQLIDNFKGIAESVGAAFVIDKVSEFAKSMAELGEQIERTAKMTGLSVDEVQKFQFAVRLTGGDAESAGMSLLRLERNMANAAAGSKTAAASFAAAGVSAKTLASGDVNAVLGEIAEKFHNTADGANKTALAMELAGRGGASLIALLDLGKVGFEEFNVELAKTNSELTEAQTTGFAKTSIAIKEMSAATEGVSVQIMDELNPGLAGAISGLTSMQEEMSRDIKEGGLMSDIIAGIGNVISGTVAAVMTLVTAFKFLGEAVTAVFTMIGNAIAGVGQKNNQALDEMTRTIDEYTKSISKMLDASNKGVIPQGGAPIGKDNKPQIQIPDQSGKDDTKNDESVQRSLYAETYAVQKEYDDLAVTSKQITKQAELTDLAAALSKEQDLIHQSFDREMALYNQTSVEYQKLLTQKQIADQKFQIEHMNLQQEQAKLDNKVWDDAFKTIESNFDSMIKGIMSGTQTLGQAFQRLAQNLVVSMVESLAKIAFEWIKTEAQKTSATIAGDATRTAADTAAATTSSVSGKAGASGQIMQDAAESAANVYADVSAIPYVGWILAPPAAAAAFAAVAAFDSFDKGTDFVPNDMLAMIHKGERIVPAAQNTAPPYTGGNAGGGDTHLHVHAIDARGVKQFFNQHGPLIAKTLSGQVRGGNRSFLQHA